MKKTKTRNKPSDIINCTHYCNLLEESVKEFKKRMHRGVDVFHPEYKSTIPPFYMEIRCIRMELSHDQTKIRTNIRLGYCGMNKKGEPMFSEDKNLIKRYSRVCAVKKAIEKLNKIVKTSFYDYYVLTCVDHKETRDMIDNLIKKSKERIKKCLKH